ncbi:MAG: hypothetical protein MUO89_06135 [Dehalococcoidia bacterium]|nr:hypothetical protein [Dehalococcoidia bacterium]
MQLRRGNIVAIIAPIAFSGMLYFLPHLVPSMPNWIIRVGFGICFILFSGAILALTPIWNKIFKIKTIPVSSVTTTSSAPTGNYNSLVPNSVKQPNPSNRPPMLFDVVLLICMSIILAFGIWMMYLWITGKLIGIVGFGQLLLFVLSIAFPILIFIDIFHWQRRQYKLGRSCVYKDKVINLDGDRDKIFDICFNILDAAPKSTIIEAYKPKLVKALINGYVVTITVKQMRNKKIEIHILSDSQWMTTKIDWGVNQRRVNKLDRLIREKIGQRVNFRTST